MRETSSPLPPAPVSFSRPGDWLRVFGPGAIIASLTIGAGELIFSSRGGALFGYRLLWYFLIILVLKWALVYGAARHMVLTGAHSFQRCMELPGPPGWLPLILGFFAALCFPIWVCFHAGTVGTLVAWLTGTDEAIRGGAHFVFGALVLVAILGLALTRGYAALERIQLTIVLLMLAGVLLSLVLLRPDWLSLLAGLLVPQPLGYPDWINVRTYPDIAARPVWVETITYVGVIGGSSYDYLAYSSYLREKKWGRAGSGAVSSAKSLAASPLENKAAQAWLKAPLIDCTLSFVAVLIFSAVFVACGAVVLGGQQRVPDGTNLLTLQAAFVTPLLPSLRHLYFAGALLAMLGTLYGTIEVAPVVLRELARAIWPDRGPAFDRRLRFIAIAWVGAVASVILIFSLVWHLIRGGDKPPGLIALLTPANLFTGVLGSGIVCALNIWMDRRFLTGELRMGKTLLALNAVAATVFLLLGLKGYWDHSGPISFVILAATVGAGWLLGRWISSLKSEM